MGLKIYPENTTFTFSAVRMEGGVITKGIAGRSELNPLLPRIYLYGVIT